MVRRFSLSHIIVGHNTQCRTTTEKAKRQDKDESSADDDDDEEVVAVERVLPQNQLQALRPPHISYGALHSASYAV